MRCHLFAAALAVASAAAAPRLTAVVPAGARAGSSVELTLTGDDLADATALRFDDPRVTAERVGKADVPKADDKPSGERRRGMASPKPTAAVRFAVTVPAGLPVGLLDVRVVTPGGVSNPRAFMVGDRPEALERENNDDVDKAQAIEPESVVHGVIANPTDVDYFAVPGKKGQRLVVSCLTTTIDSRLPAAVQLFEASGRQLAFNRGYRNDDALCDAVLPADGTYYVRVAHFTYTSGGPDHFYRLSVGTAPWIDAVFPPAVEPGQAAKVTVFGRNLPGGQTASGEAVDGRPLESAEVAVTAPGDPARLDLPWYVPPPMSAADGFPLRVASDSGSSPPALVGYAAGPVTLDRPGNDSEADAQALAVPGEAAGRVESRSDRDWFRFRATKGEPLSVELLGDRAGSSMDLYLTVRAAGGKVLAEADDNPDVLGPVQFYTRSDDPPRVRFVPPADGDYFAVVSSREASVQFGPREVYRLRVSPERPDFRLVVMPLDPYRPEAATLGKGGDQCLAVYCWRLDGFAGPVELRAEGLPPGVTCPPQALPPGAKSTYLVVSASPDAAAWTGAVKVVGTAAVGGKPLTREARPAGVVWPVPAQGGNQAVPAISRLERELVLAVREAPPLRLGPDAPRLVVPPGGKGTFNLQVERLRPDFKEALRLAFVSAVPGVAVGGATPAGNNQPPTLPLPADTKAVPVTLDVKNNAPPGVYTLVFQASPAAKGGGNRGAPPAVAAVSRPLTLVVLPKEALAVGVTPAESSARAGAEVELRVRVTRAPGFDGPVALELVTKEGPKAATAEPVTLAAGADEAVLRAKLGDKAKPGDRLRLAVRATVTVEGAKQPLEQEAKVRVNVTK